MSGLPSWVPPPREKQKKYVLLEQKDERFDGMWYPMFVGVVLAETDQRYLVRRKGLLGFILPKLWVPIDGKYMKCREITYATDNS